MIQHRAPIAIAVGIGYMALYLYMLGDLGFGASGWDLRVSRQWPTLWLKARAPFQFEGIAMIHAGWLSWIISPLNLAIAAVLGWLLAANTDGAIALRQAPPACRAPGAGTGALAALPALLAGGACCAPALILLIGLPSLGAVAGLFSWLVPVAMVALAASRWWQRRLAAPAFAPRWRARQAGTHSASPS